MSTKYKELLEWADTVCTERDEQFPDRWLAACRDKQGAVNELAVFLAKDYVNGRISFDIANTLLNQVMPVIGFEEAPDVFWRFYHAFEDYEMLDEPDVSAMPRIKSELSKINEI